MARPRPRRDLSPVAIAVWLAIGSILGAAAYAIAPERMPLGLAGALVAGSLGGLLGATAESALEGSSAFRLDPASVAGAVCGAVVLVVLLTRAGEIDAEEAA